MRGYDSGNPDLAEFDAPVGQLDPEGAGSRGDL